MKIKVGDKVKFLNDVGGGKVTKIIDKETVTVLNDTGFEIPVLIDELLLDISGKPDRRNAEQSPMATPAHFESPKLKPTPVVYTDTCETNFYLAFLPDNYQNPQKCEIYLINDSNYFVMYHLAQKKNEKYTSFTGILEPNIKERIAEKKLLELEENYSPVLQLIWFDKQEFDLKEPLHKLLNIRKLQLVKEGSYKANDFFEKDALVVPVVEENLMQEAIEKLKQGDFTEAIRNKENAVRKNRSPLYPKKEDKNIKEVDLHLHELIDDERGMSDHEKLEFQIEVFHKELKNAKKEGYRRIVFIHGVGNGTLKHKIRNELTHRYKQYLFQDASFKEYGYGATMVLLRK
ncbi:MAG: hypothetical protein CSB06_03215 [Bacteroidia bacterium]|nr:MAG: hypothetical protein CSB06_03215 [Bacteroidia bacterium]